MIIGTTETYHNRTANQINEDYRASVAKRQAEYARREASWHAFWLFLTQLCAVLNFFFSAAVIVMSIGALVQAIHTQHTPTPVGVFVAGFLIVQACGWTYILLFPRYITNLR